MFDDDPFKNTPESKSEKPKTKKEDSVTEETETTVEGKIVTTYKFSGAYDAPWIVTYAKDPAEARKISGSSAFKAHVSETFELWKAFRAEVEKQGLESAPKAPGGSGGSPSRGKRPNPPGTPEIECEHGLRTYFTKNNWEALFCPHEEKSEQCPPLFKQKNGKYEENKR